MGDEIEKRKGKKKTSVGLISGAPPKPRTDTQRTKCENGTHPPSQWLLIDFRGIKTVSLISSGPKQQESGRGEGAISLPALPHFLGAIASLAAASFLFLPRKSAVLMDMREATS